MALLEVRDLRAGYGSVPVLHGVTLDVEEGSNAVLVGLNGAGKTTTLFALAGLLAGSGGEIWFGGQRLDRLGVRHRVRRGVVLVPEGRRVFPALTVAQNLRLGPGRGGGTGGTSVRRWPGCTGCSRCWRSAGTSSPAPCPAGSSRCWRSPGG